MLFGLFEILGSRFCVGSEFCCHANVYLSIKLRTPMDLLLTVDSWTSMSLQKYIHCNVSISHENFSSGWMEDRQNHHFQMKRSLSAHRLHSIVPNNFMSPTTYSRHKVYTLRIYISNFPHTRKLSYRWARTQFACMLINGMLCARRGYMNMLGFFVYLSLSTLNFAHFACCWTLNCCQ